MYYLKDIILGLRNEYLKNQKELAILKKCLVFNTNKVKDINPFIKIDDEIIQIMLSIEKRQNILKIALKNIDKIFNKTEQENPLKIQKKSNNEYFIRNNCYNVEVIESYQNKFQQAIKNLQENKVALKIGSYSKAYLKDGLACHLDINPNYTTFTIFDEEYFILCNYNPATDELIIKTDSKKAITEEDCRHILEDIEIDKDILSTINQKIIDENLIKNNITLYAKQNYHEIKLKIKQSDNNYCLKKTK